ncbi:MAG: TIGR00730 family Rossman fold protein [Gammaproteobacteria bacterium]|nr:TIGR00730 family Rossman fold protein [Gammaproteobacteria bacterium]
MSHDTQKPNPAEHPSYQLAFEDVDFLAKDDLRPLRLQLELLKPEWYLREARVRSTVVVFGSARLLPLNVARARLAELLATIGEHPADAGHQGALAEARKRVKYAPYYDEARKFGALVSARFQKEQRRDFVVVTGGGPGIMEAANRGAAEVGARSAGFNIQLPHEQSPNRYISEELCFRFHYFALRKMHFLMRAKALLAFPGGYGTLDELFDVLTLMQTGKIARIPVVLVGAAFWRRAIDFDFLAEEGVIGAADAELFNVVETAEQAVDVLERFYGGRPPP